MGIELEVPYLEQSRSSSACGTISLKMILDYYKILNSHNLPFSIPQLTQLLRVEKSFGVEETELEAFLKDKGLIIRSIRYSEIDQVLRAKNPILTAFKDELNDGHYAVIKGYSIKEGNLFLTFHDPWPDYGANYIRPLELFKEQCHELGGWLKAVAR